ncbi:MAG: RnfABCDGE type electron transport complex subunit G [Endomicrobiales bacterium]|nr:RnfABCDGE type electron transport complex subunit G [Endomicrobiales bacterium]
MKIIKLGLILLIVTVLSATSLSLVYLQTADRILEVKKEKVYKLQKEILPLAESFEDIDEGTVKVGYDGDKNEVGRIISVSPKGYAGNIEMLVGIDNEDRITMIKIVKQSETPGLGSQVSKSDFLGQFKNKNLAGVFLRRESTDGEIDAITGATISSRAVAKGAQQAIQKNIKAKKSAEPDSEADEKD